jgi:mxaK protein
MRLLIDHQKLKSALLGARMKQQNIIFGLILGLGLAGSLVEGYQLYKANQVNHALVAGLTVADESYSYQKRFAAAYDQGQHQDYKHAVQSYTQLLETLPDVNEQARVQFNIGNNLFLSGLIRRLNDDGTLKDEAKYAFSQARFAYEQALRVSPNSRPAKFNLSLLHAVMPANMKSAPKEQTGMELSNLPIGLP